MESKCLICDINLLEPYIDTGINFLVNCPNCGKFEIKNRAIKSLPLLSENHKAVISYSIRKQHIPGQVVVVNSSFLDQYKNDRLPSPIEQSDSLVVWLGNNLFGLGNSIDIGR